MIKNNLIQIRDLSNDDAIECQNILNNALTKGMVIRFNMSGDKLIKCKVLARDIKELHIKSSSVKLCSPEFIDEDEVQYAYILDASTMKLIDNSDMFETYVAENLAKSANSYLLDNSVLFLCRLNSKNGYCESYEVNFLEKGMLNDIDTAFDNIEDSDVFISFKSSIGTNPDLKSYVGRVMKYPLANLHESSGYDLHGQSAWRDSVYVFEKSHDRITNENTWKLTHVVPSKKGNILMPNACAADVANYIVSVL